MVRLTVTPPEKPMSTYTDMQSAKAAIVDTLAPLSRQQQKSVVETLVARIGLQKMAASSVAGERMAAEFLQSIAHLPLKEQNIQIARRKRGMLQEYNKARVEADSTRIQCDALDDFIKWSEQRPCTLERPDGSAFHKLVEARRDKRVFVAPKEAEERFEADVACNPQVFLVEHNWADAFRGAGEFAEGDFKLPFDAVCFEFKVSGQRICVVVQQADDGVISYMSAVQSTNDYWIVFDLTACDDVDHEMSKCSALIRENIRAVCIALDAEVAVTEVERAPHKLNEARAKKGKPPLKDYHVVSLARRSRAAPFGSGKAEPSYRVRLHFRRGHWRHYETHKTWIKWMLVGSADLGFIDKHYKL